ncbi:TasA family protein [Chloroflexota bacterium]
MRKILGLTIAALLVMGLVGAGTWAYFTDTEQSTGNILTAGTLDLNINGADAAVTTLSVSTAYPGDTGSGNSTLYNNGSQAAVLDIVFGSASNTESTGDTEYEADNISGAGVGELGSQATFAAYIDVDMGGAWNGGDIGLSANGTGELYSFPMALEYQALNNYSTDNFSNVYSGNMAVGAQDGFYILYDIPTGANNAIQGDSVSVDITFTLRQP